MPRPVTSNDSEHALLLPGPSYVQQGATRSRMRVSLASLAGWKPHPYWLIPVVLIMSMSRGITMSPRIQVYKAIACRSILKDSTGVGLAALLLDPECDEKEVQARAVNIQATVITTMSVLSAFTAGFWSRMGEKHGRKLVFGCFFIGAMIMEAGYIFVMKADWIFGRYGESWIMAGPIIEGLAGGLSVFNGVVHAYVSDCTRHGSRSKIFSTIQGMIFVGLATGPWFAGFFLPKKGYSDSFFLWSIGLLSFNMLYILVICPESKSRPDEVTPQPDVNQPGFKASPLPTIRRKFRAVLSSILLPLFMFAPRRLKGTRQRTFAMVFIGMSLLLYIISTGVYTAKYMYAQHVYKWTTAELGYYMSTLWIVRAFNLLVFLPIVISYLKPKPTGDGNPNAHDIAAELNFDRYLAQISVGVDGLADALVAITASRSEGLYVTLSCLSSFTSGGNPALHSLGAVCLHACGYSSEVGSLFGAMAVIAALGHIVSPRIYAATYSRTVGTYPEAIFVLAACLLFSVVVFLSRVNLDERKIESVHSRQSSLMSHYDYESIVSGEEGDEVDRRHVHQHERTVSSVRHHDR